MRRMRFCPTPWRPTCSATTSVGQTVLSWAQPPTSVVPGHRQERTRQARSRRPAASGARDNWPGRLCGLLIIRSESRRLLAQDESRPDRLRRPSSWRLFSSFKCPAGQHNQFLSAIVCQIVSWWISTRLAGHVGNRIDNHVGIAGIEFWLDLPRRRDVGLRGRNLERHVFRSCSTTLPICRIPGPVLWANRTISRPSICDRGMQRQRYSHSRWTISSSPRLWHRHRHHHRRLRPIRSRTSSTVRLPRRPATTLTLATRRLAATRLRSRRVTTKVSWESSTASSPAPADSELRSSRS